MERYVVIDLETTGHSAKLGEKIIQIGAVVIEAGQIVERFASYVNPKKEIPPFITELTGITDEHVTEAPLFSELIPFLLPMLENADFVAHNVLFDYSFLKHELEAHGYELNTNHQYDTVELARILLPSEESYKLGHLAEQLGFEHERPHQADSDAEVTGELFLLLLEKLNALPTSTLEHLQRITKTFRSDIDHHIENLLRQDRKAQDNLFDHFRSLSLRRMEKESSENSEQPPPLQTVLQQLKDDQMKDTKQAFERYEKRAGQLQMMEAISNAFESNEHILIEAGTGTGKSIAYLFPAAFYSVANQVPIVVSTQTIPLQEQLLTKDIPILKKLLPFQLNVALLKGRNHYLCLRKFEQSLTYVEDDTYDVQLTKAQILVWITETTTGDIEELSLPTGGRTFWHDVKSDANTELGSFNPWLSRCYYARARRRAQKANIIITNHALLFTDLATEQPLLPAYKHAIIDEAHHFEEAASNHLGQSTDYLSFTYVFARLTSGADNGLLNKLKDMLERYHLFEANPYFKMEKKLKAMNEEVDELFRMLFRYVEKHYRVSTSDVGRVRYRYQSFKESGPIWDAILESCMRLHVLCKDMFTPLMNFCSLLNDLEELAYLERALLADIHAMAKQLYENEQVLYELLLEADLNYVYWIEIEAKGAKNAAFLYKKPIDVAETLADRFFTEKKSVVLTSATLTVNQSFDYQVERLGLEDFGVKRLLIPTSFDYEKQARLLLPTDMPSIKEVSETEYAMEVAIKIERISQETKGKILVLFTSFEMLRAVYEYMKDLRTDETTTTIIAQGITSGSRIKLIKLFKQSESGLLFGTSSFWEGIDMPGAELEHLVIVRLPFSPPGEPHIEAQFEKAKEAGLNPFMAVSLPQAIIRFKQGFGRLIRTKEDKGCIYILDRRISTTRYGSAFVKSLPPIPISKGKLERLLEEVQEFQKNK
ncbi:DNA polymerase III subunit epsilon [Alkalihalobacillus alcalophilus ATCC 27647 = CGMCC 1.3604]|uniref:3'-5' exonuclease DinG n=1 Tax=Alkalihalobacillus alcalophilus ATCC 27647 = CGMCC 1.3604 TaxID=1218173 RepID=A0A094WMW6_ALKAL|nr:ATP-dependent DNA helicase DinG [Alkalihalobacillus alcalophilus]KGA99109.1 DNA polymerase III subunit epsilon [Alkalihalobacillus alcalophilus ATCC 27647 = CGMCC 1.3604]MED1563467.1 ATP-dependent DNA helicase DinG [Alkalihalobacillus alcalophilus]THG90312.1 DNA polymerase III subunit epsilon [Alkalihalobacillus alcalophilus ATCC 27647 = CGMCC 1.3604]